ncbi:MAG: hypothetical protein AAF547_08065 [Actinomycetota bacterium]
MAAERIAGITPEPTDEEAAAIAAAVLVGWPQAAAPATGPAETSTRWRFSGRWWRRRTWNRDR